MSGRESLDATDLWFRQHGLPYFVPEEREAVRKALRWRRLVPLLVVVALVAAAAGALLAWASGQVSAAPALLVALGLLAAVGYALTALRARPIVAWALARTASSLRHVLANTTRALPLLLLAITFLFINTEMWQVGSTITVGTLWLLVVLFALIAVGFLLVRLPEEVDAADDHVDDDLLLRACAGTPLDAEARALVADPEVDPASYAEVTGYERGNLILVLMVVQLAQVVLLSASVFVFLMVFGSLTMTDPVMDAWLTDRSIPASAALAQVSVFLAAFSGLYLTVSTMTDEAYRAQFFGGVTRELERAVGMRAVYLALRDRGRAAESAS